jgi:hypothetical protein
MNVAASLPDREDLPQIRHLKLILIRNSTQP